MYQPSIWGGDPKRAQVFVDADIPERRFIGKNVCHTIEYNADIHSRLEPKDRASELFKEAMDMYLVKHKSKKFHDPTAAVCCLHPEVATWVRGVPTYNRGKWTTTLKEDGDFVAADVDREMLWDHIVRFW
jgi:inosine-uridine nucleoside N-ribohydrolase